MVQSDTEQTASGLRSPESELPSEAARTEAYNAELINRYRTGQFLTETDKREARKLIYIFGSAKP